MSRQLDGRPVRGARLLTPERESALAAAADEASRALPGTQRVTIAKIDSTTGNPAVVALEEGVPAEGNFVQRALEHVQAIGGALGFAPKQATEFAADPVVQQAQSGARTVHLQQLYKGIPVYGAARTVRFQPTGAIDQTLGSTVTVSENRPVGPQVSVERAVRLAAEHVAQPDDDELGALDQYGQPLRLVSVDLEGFEPKVIATFTDKPDLPSVLQPGPFGAEIKASLIWFPLEELHLGWEVLLTLGDYVEQYRTIVDAESGEILFCRQLVRSLTARGNVYRVHGGRPREMVEFPLALEEHGMPPATVLPDGFPDPWIEGDRAVGNAVFARLGETGPTIRGTLADGHLVFDPTDPSGDEQKVLNIFYFNCVMHDFFYLLGFREREGNFQRDNLGRGGVASDLVDARAYREPVEKTASMVTLVDGRSPVMKMGPVGNRHTAFDATVVFHEFMHGVTHRLVGGRMNERALDDPQSAGMGEGWGDYVACTINETTVIGAWVVDDPGGIRKFRYDGNFPDTFADLGTGRYVQEHSIGEIWCATLMEMNREIGPVLGMQLVVEALRSPPNPSFLDMRDSILAALDAKLTARQLTANEHLAARTGIWKVFARFGMGPGARSDGASLRGIVADFTAPADTG